MKYSGGLKASNKRYYLAHRDELLIKNREYGRSVEAKRLRRERYERLRIEVLTHYGNGICACVECGESRLPCLSLDHMNNDGAEHRRKVKHQEMYRWVRRNGYPDNFQTLCMNDQWLKKFEHERRGQDEDKSSSC